MHDVALALPGSDQYLAQPPERWVALAAEHARDDADGYFLSCTNTTQIEAIEPIERKLGKPVVNSNQAVLWACMKRLRHKLGASGTGAGAWATVRGRPIIRPTEWSDHERNVNAATAAPRFSMRDRMAMYTDNALKIGLFGSNCSSGRAVTLVPERWTGNWEDNLALAKMSRRGRHRIHAAGRPLEGLWRRHRLHGHDAGDHHLGDRACSPTPSG